jgi:hypothetical protein
MEGDENIKMSESYGDTQKQAADNQKRWEDQREREHKEEYGA